MLSISGELIVSRYVAELLITTDAGGFGHVGLCRLRIQNSLVAVDKGLCGRNVLHQFSLILLHICSRSVRPISYGGGVHTSCEHQLMH